MRPKILVIMTGSIAAFKMCQAISLMIKKQWQVKVVMTEASLKFVGAATIEGLTGEKPFYDLWQSGEAMAHIELDRWADLILMAPATANTINQWANGTGTGLVGALQLAHDFKKPVLLAPAMNTKMYQHPTTVESLNKLKSWGVVVLDSPSGALACGETGEGRLMEPESMIDAIATILKKSESPKLMIAPAAAKPFRVLVTSGGTREPLDGVRVITNKSTGATGAALVSALTERGFCVDQLAAEGSHESFAAEQVSRFSTHQDLAQKLQEKISSGRYQAVVHLAAVSDFKPVAIVQNGERFEDFSLIKISSQAPITIEMQPTEKIVNHIRSWGMQTTHLTAFKMTTGATPQIASEKVARLFANSKAQVVVHNDLSQIKDPVAEHPMQIYTTAAEPQVLVSDVAGLADFLTQQYLTLVTKGAQPC